MKAGDSVVIEFVGTFTEGGEGGEVGDDLVLVGGVEGGGENHSTLNRITPKGGEFDLLLGDGLDSIKEGGERKEYHFPVLFFEAHGKLPGDGMRFVQQDRSFKYPYNLSRNREKKKEFRGNRNKSVCS